jgi:arginyl-tRNA synthetase
MKTGEGFDLWEEVRRRIIEELGLMLPGLPEATRARIEISPPRNPAHGDLATNAALIVASEAKRPPRALAAELAERLARHPELIAAAEAAGPGFVNLRLADQALQRLLPAILRAGEAYGASDVGGGVAVNVEYVSANPTGPMHVGHARGAVVGDALARLLAHTNHRVTKEFYINDAGAQVEALAWAVYARYVEALGFAFDESAVPGGLQYRGAYLIPLGEALAREFGDRYAPEGKLAPPEEWMPLFRERAVAAMMEEIREDLRLLGVEHDVFTSEAALARAGRTAEVLAALEAKGLIYEGVLEPPKGHLPEDWEPRPQLLFRSSAFGDVCDRPLRKSDGSATYFANDIAYHADKIARGFEVLIDVWGADHAGYVPRMKAAVAALGGGRVRLEVVLCQIVHVLKGGEPVRMSKRAGSYVTLRDLLDEVGRDVVRFFMLTRKSDAQMEFDLDKVLAETKDNPVFYVQYAHARTCSVLRHAREAGFDVGPERLAAVPLDALTDPAERAVMLRLSGWPRLVAGAARAREPHRIAFYLYDLAGDFHLLWNRGREQAELRFIIPEARAETEARLALVAATGVVLRAGMALMGVTPREELR